MIIWRNEIALNIKRKYDGQNRLVYELKDDNEETIIRYDQNGNKVYEKEWKLSDGAIWCERTMEYDENNNLVHFKDPENLNEYWVEYDKFNRPIKQTWCNGEERTFEYDEMNNVIRTCNEKGEVECEIVNEYLE